MKKLLELHKRSETRVIGICHVIIDSRRDLDGSGETVDLARSEAFILNISQRGS